MLETNSTEREYKMLQNYLQAYIYTGAADFIDVRLLTN